MDKEKTSQLSKMGEQRITAQLQIVILSMQLHRFYHGYRNWPSPSWLGLWQVQVKSPSESPSWPSPIVLTSLAPKSKPTFPSTLEFDPSLPLSLGHHLFFYLFRILWGKKWPIFRLDTTWVGGWCNNALLSWTLFEFHSSYIPRRSLWSSGLPTEEQVSEYCFSCLLSVTFFWKSKNRSWICLSDLSSSAFCDDSMSVQVSPIVKISFLIVSTSFAIEYRRSSLTSCNS